MWGRHAVKQFIFLLSGRQFRLGKRWRRTTSTIPSAASHRLKNMKLFSYEKIQCELKNLDVAQIFQKVTEKDTLIIFMDFVKKVECSLYNQKWQIFSPSVQKSIFCQKIRSSHFCQKLKYKLIIQSTNQFLHKKIKVHFFNQKMTKIGCRGKKLFFGKK